MERSGSCFYRSFYSMTKLTHSIISACLEDSNFYPQEDPERRKVLASELADKVAAGNDLIASDLGLEFVQLETLSEITLEASAEGELIRFKDAVLAAEETNKNDDDISKDNIAELAASIVGRAVDIDHKRGVNAGYITEAHQGVDRRGRVALLIGGMLWRDRYPEQVDGVRKGTHNLSVEAMADTAICSVCKDEFSGSKQYCNHLKARKAHGAKRQFRGLRGKGAGITTNPAGSGTEFDRNQIYVVANHLEEEIMDCPHCGKEATGDSCAACGKSTVASVIATELKTAQEALVTANTSLEAAQAETATAKTEATTKVSDLEAKLATAIEDARLAQERFINQRNSARKSVLSQFLTAEKLDERQESLLPLEDEAFNSVVASLTDAQEAGKKTPQNAGLRLPDPATQARANKTGLKKLVLS